MTSDNVARRSAYPPVRRGQDDQYAAGHDSHSQAGQVTGEGTWLDDGPDDRAAPVPAPRPAASRDGDFRLPGYSYRQEGQDAPGYGEGNSYPSGDSQAPGAPGNGTNQTGGYGNGSYGSGSYESAGRADPGYGSGDYGSAGDRPGSYGTADYPTSSYPAASDAAGSSATGGYATGGYATGGHATGGHETEDYATGGSASGGYSSREPADRGYGDPGYGSAGSADPGYGTDRYQTGRSATGGTGDTGYEASGYGTGGTGSGYESGGYGPGTSDAGYRAGGYGSGGSDAGYGSGSYGTGGPSGHGTGGSDAGYGSGSYGTGGPSGSGYAADGYASAGAADSRYRAGGYGDDRYGSAGPGDSGYGASDSSGTEADLGYSRRGYATDGEAGYRDSGYGAPASSAGGWAETGSHLPEAAGYGSYGGQNGLNDYSASDPGANYSPSDSGANYSPSDSGAAGYSAAGYRTGDSGAAGYRTGDSGTGGYQTGEYGDQYRAGRYGDDHLASDSYDTASYRSPPGASEYGADYPTGSYGAGDPLDPSTSMAAEPLQPRERGSGREEPAVRGGSNPGAAGRYQPPGLPEAVITGHGWPEEEPAGLAGPGRQQRQDQPAAWAGGPEPHDAWDDDDDGHLDDEDPAGDDRLLAKFGRDGGGRKPRRGRHRWILTCICIVILLIAALGLGMGARLASQWWTKRYGNYPGEGYGSVKIQVTAGEGATQLAPQLVSAGIIEAAGPFITAASASNTSVLQPGYYKMHYHMNAARAWALLLSPSAGLSTRVTIPEGLRASQIVLTLSKATGIAASKFEQVLHHPAALGLPSYAKGNPEGYLFPATYPVSPGETATQILQAMVARFNQEATQVNLVQAGAKVNLPPAEVIIIASLVQAEAGKISDFGKISRVIDNRLNDHIKLQFDSTVLYGLNKYGIRASAQDLQSTSKYNTYRYYGLPPGAIGNPGDLAIQAALHPPKGGWLYFITVDPATKLTKFTSSYTQFLQWEQQAKNG